MFQEEDDDVFGFKSFESTFEIENKFKILEKYSTKNTFIHEQETTAWLFYNFYPLGIGKFYSGHSGIVFDGKSRLTIDWNKIIEIGLKKDPESEVDLLNLKLDSQVFIQFKFSDINSVLMGLEAHTSNTRLEHTIHSLNKKPIELETMELAQPPLDLKEIPIEILEKERQLKILQENYDLEFKRINDQKLLLLHEISQLDIQLKDLQQEFTIKKLDLMESQCNLCFDGKIEVVFRPCGHEICRNCLEKLKSLDFTVCPWDRLQVQTEIFYKF